MTSPYSVAPTTAPVQQRRPSYEDLKRRAEEGGYGGGRGIMDTREWYELCYFTPLEDFMFKALKARYREMSDNDIAVCISTWIYDNSVSRATYEHITERLLFVDAEEYDAHREEIVQAAYKRGYVFVYRMYRYADEAKNNGQGSGPFLAPRDDIDNFLDELVWRECIENDAAILAANGKEAWKEVQKIHRNDQIEFAKDSVKFYFHINEKGEHIPLTEQEQKDYIASFDSPSPSRDSGV